MKNLAALVALSAMCATAQAADVIAPEPPLAAPIDVSPEMRRAFVAVKFGYGPAFADNDIETEAVAAAGLPALSGQVENDYLVGASIEAGYFLTDNFRMSAELTYGYLENDTQVIDASPATDAVFTATGGLLDLAGPDQLDGQTFTTQGFVKAAYEVPVAENFLFLRDLRLFATAGVGFVHVNNNLVINDAGSAFNGARAESQDTVLAGKVGFGTVSKLTDAIALTSEFNYLFGGDSELELVSADGNTVVPFKLETEAILFQTGIRVAF